MTKWLLGALLIIVAWAMFWYIGDEHGHLVQLFMTASVLLVSGVAVILNSLPYSL